MYKEQQPGQPRNELGGGGRLPYRPPHLSELGDIAAHTWGDFMGTTSDDGMMPPDMSFSP
jgi:hypothetical protein